MLAPMVRPGPSSVPTRACAGRRGRAVLARRLAAILCTGLICVLFGSGGLVRPAQAEFGQDERKFQNDGYPQELRRRVQEALLKGSNYLLIHQRDDGSWASPYGASYPMGPTALAVLALLKSGVPPGHPRVEKAFSYLRGLPLERTYEVGILLMALDARYDPAPDPFAAEEVDRYGQRVVAEPCADLISKEDLAWMKQGVDFLVKSKTSICWRYPSGGYDLSNTQYALLGLKAADRCGLKVPTSVWLDSLSFLLGQQEADGPEVEVRANEVRGAYRIEWKEKAKARGFRYAEAATARTGSMTTAGAACLMICQSMLWKSRKFSAEERQRTRTGVRDALAWMQLHFDVTRNPQGPPQWHYYYLYGLERMGILAHTRYLGRADWYLEGAELLLHDQDASGSWWDGDVVDTCFALLFLKRSSFRTANPVITPSESGPPAVEPKTDGTRPEAGMGEPAPGPAPGMGPK